MRKALIWIVVAGCGSPGQTSDLSEADLSMASTDMASSMDIASATDLASADMATIRHDLSFIDGPPGAITYSTNFNLTESPVSEGGAWHHNGLDWTTAKTSGGLAYGTQTGSGGFDDSYAYLSGFPPDQSASAVIHLESGVSAAYAEVEILLRWTDSAHFSRGYECNLAFNSSYAQIIRWPGAFGTQLSDFAFLSAAMPIPALKDGDILQCDIVGNVITERLNGQVIATATDSVITSGNPGMGFYWQSGAATSKYGFTSYSATSL